MIRTGKHNSQLKVVEGYKAFRMEQTREGLRLASDMIKNSSNAVDVDWLPLAAEQYCISPDINDYIICDVPIVHANVPNRNLDEFPLEEMSRFDTNTGRLVFQSFIGKPTHKDHDNKDPRRAKGVIFDASVEKQDNGIYAIRILAGYDRTKDVALTDDIFSGKRPGHSMGALVGYTRCSYPGCQHTSTNGSMGCSHMEGNAGKGRVIDSHLIYERCYNVCFIENSSVGDAANVFAQQAWAR